MVSAPSLYPLQASPGLDEPRVVLRNVPWATYVVLRDTVDSPAVRMTYLQGTLEIMSPSRRHEVTKKLIARFLELFCLEREIRLFAYGSTTFRNEAKERGLEPDECYCRDTDRDVPDVAIEVVVTAAVVDKLDVYRGLGVREVWIFQDGKPRVLTLDDDEYRPVGKSAIFPEVNLDRIATLATESDQHAALTRFRDELRAAPKPAG